MRQEFIGTEGKVLLDTIRRLYRRKARSALAKVLKKIHPAELAWMFRHLTARERLDIFEMLKEPEMMPWGRKTAFISDPDGNIHELYSYKAEFDE